MLPCSRHAIAISQLPPSTGVCEGGEMDSPGAATGCGAGWAGLALVRACADLWGWRPLSRHGNRGKLVWCELATA